MSVNILLLEDDESDAEVVQRFLTWAKNETYQVTHHESIAEGCQSLASGRFDVILLDLRLTDADETESFSKIREKAPDTPIVVLTGTGSEDLGPELVRKGAQDFLIKGHFDVVLLQRSIRFAMERQRLLIELERARAVADRQREDEILERIARQTI